MPMSTVGEKKPFIDDSLVAVLWGTRTATMGTDCVLYYLNPEMLDDSSMVHEMVARALVTRMDYLNRRLLWEML